MADDDKPVFPPSVIRHPSSCFPMNYTQSLRYLDSFVNLEKLSRLPDNAFFNLRRMEHLLKASGHPEKKFFPVLVAGTTGKGSTGFFLESILKANGIRTGYYHSPHVEDPRERIRLQGAMASKALWAEGLSGIRELLRRSPLPRRLGVLTYFEITTFLAILIFAKAGIRVGVFEIGLGGRLDATNVLKAPLVLLTPIHLDHMAFLGHTVWKIAGEKAAIIKSHGQVVTGRQSSEALSVIRTAVRKNRGHLWRAKPLRGMPLGLAGEFQKWNAGMAMKAADVLREHFGFSITKERSREGLLARNWMGRMETFCKSGRIFLLDGAHNPISMAALVRSLRVAGVKPRFSWLVFGAMNDKDSRRMLEILSRYFSRVILTGIGSPRAKTSGMLVQEAKGLFKSMLTSQNVREAFALVRKVSQPGARVVITGSFYLVGEMRKLLKTGQRTMRKAQR
ncbi:MAG TPA: cyanophycin synthetase [Candidatus Omnitrophota bacterium]|nr:cyanophycin synthetase [Candidatus Omnitrophota bacterium]HPS36226.1 cyanophycin synthetase [Candidatus Omnitrophota bacterium]